MLRMGLWQPLYSWSSVARLAFLKQQRCDRKCLTQVELTGVALTLESGGVRVSWGGDTFLSVINSAVRSTASPHLAGTGLRTDCKNSFKGSEV